MQPPPRSSATEDLQRVACEHADRCGGCPVIALAYGEQLGMKRGRVVQSAARYPSLELVYTEPVQPAEPIVGYRTRAKLIVAPGGRLGLFAKGGGHQVVDIPGCKVVAPVIADVAALLRRRLREDEESDGPLAPFDPAHGTGVLRATDLREIRQADGTSAVLVTFVVQKANADREALTALAATLAAVEPRILGVALNLHEGESPQILGSETVVIHGAAAVPDRIGVATHQATFGSFVQAHRGQAERIHQTVTELLGVGKRESRPKILDLYGGSGAIALALAHAGADVHLVESFAPAAAHVDEAAKRSKLPVKAEAGDVASSLRRFADRKARYDAAVVNPPRRGMSPLARELVARLELPLIAYVSCDPDTLARDLDHFTRLGYAVTSLRPLDMIPLTDEVETVALLRRIGMAAPKVLWEDEEIVLVDKGAHEPTSPQNEYASSLLARVRSLPGAANAVPLHRIDAGTSGLVFFVKDPAGLAKWQAVMDNEATRKIYVAGARGVTPAKGAINRDLREDGKMLPARTRYRRLAVASGHSVLRVVPEHGRTHQIRRHLAAIGHPILGDDRYGHAPTNRFFEEKNALDRTFLHCVRLEFTHPRTNQRLIVEAPMPGDLRSVLERTSGPGTLKFLDHKNALGHSGASSLPPPPDSGSVLDVSFESSSPNLPREMIGIPRTGYPPPNDERASVLEMEPQSLPTIHPQMTSSDDD